MNLSPPSTGNTQGVLYYQVPSNTSNPNFNGPKVNMQGLIYCPGAQINYDGNTGNYLVIVAGSANSTATRPKSLHRRRRADRTSNKRCSTMRTPKSQRGSAMVEFAVVLPMLAMLMIGLIDVGRYTYFAIMAAHAARAGCSTARRT